MTTVITPIGLEHTTILGETYGEIAAEKAEIIKHECPLALAPQHPEAQAVFERVAKERNVPIVEVKNFIRSDSSLSAPRIVYNTEGLPIAQQFDGVTDSEFYSQLTVPLLGHHQFVNATTALAGLECLKQQGCVIPKASIYAGFKNVQWDGTDPASQVFTYCCTGWGTLSGFNGSVVSDAPRKFSLYAANFCCEFNEGQESYGNWEYRFKNC